MDDSFDQIKICKPKRAPEVASALSPPLLDTSGFYVFSDRPRVGNLAGQRPGLSLKVAASEPASGNGKVLGEQKSVDKASLLAPSRPAKAPSCRQTNHSSGESRQGCSRLVRISAQVL